MSLSRFIFLFVVVATATFNNSDVDGFIFSPKTSSSTEFRIPFSNEEVRASKSGCQQNQYYGPAPWCKKLVLSKYWYSRAGTYIIIQDFNTHNKVSVQHYSEVLRKQKRTNNGFILWNSKTGYTIFAKLGFTNVMGRFKHVNENSIKWSHGYVWSNSANSLTVSRPSKLPSEPTSKPPRIPRTTPISRTSTPTTTPSITPIPPTSTPPKTSPTDPSPPTSIPSSTPSTIPSHPTSKPTRMPQITTLKPTSKPRKSIATPTSLIRKTISSNSNTCRGFYEKCSSKRECTIGSSCRNRQCLPNHTTTGYKKCTQDGNECTSGWKCVKINSYYSQCRPAPKTCSST